MKLKTQEQAPKKSAKRRKQKKEGLEGKRQGLRHDFQEFTIFFNSNEPTIQGQNYQPGLIEKKIVLQNHLCIV